VRAVKPGGTRKTVDDRVAAAAAIGAHRG